MINVMPLVLLAVLVYIGLFVRHLRQRRALSEHLMFAVFYAYIVGVVAVCFFPLPVQPSLLRSLHQAGYHAAIAWNPLRSLALTLTHDRLPDIVYSVGGNLLLLFPLGLLLPLTSAKVSTHTAWITGIVLSVTIETAQYTLDGVLGFAYRSPAVEQVVLNGIGCGVGGIVVGRLATRGLLPTYRWTRRMPDSSASAE